MTPEQEELKACRLVRDYYTRRTKDLTGRVARIKNSTDRTVQSEVRKALEKEHSFFERREPRQVQISRAFTDSDGDGELAYATLRLDTDTVDKVLDVFVTRPERTCFIHESKQGCIEIKALFYTNQRGLKTLTLQRWRQNTKPATKKSISLSGDDLRRFLLFIAGVFNADFGEGSVAIKFGLEQMAEIVTAMSRGEEDQMRPGPDQEVIRERFGDRTEF
jgi:hypothetical protein